MPLVSTLNFSELATRVVTFFKTLADSVIVSTSTPSHVENDDVQKRSQTEENAEKVPAAGLFPAINVDKSLESSSAVPCSMEVTPGMVQSHDGVEWKLNYNTALPTPSSGDNSSVHSAQSAQSVSEEPAGEGDEEQSLFVCHYCDAEFKIRGYLTRHIKKHAIAKAYQCPFWESDSVNKCHQSGGFSRRDTYKTHLKSRHFLYPRGIKAPLRNTSGGNCGHCNAHFDNSNEWIEKHIEGKECPGLPEEYDGRLKNARKSGKIKEIKTSNGMSRFISSSESTMEPNVLLNKDALEALSIVVKREGTSNIHIGSPPPSAKGKKPKKVKQRRNDLSALNVFSPQFSDLEPVRSGSSNDATTVNTLDHLSPMSLVYDNFIAKEVVVPENDYSLDMEQCPTSGTILMNNSNITPGMTESLQAKLDQQYLVEKQQREQTQYLNYYNYLFSSNQ